MSNQANTVQHYWQYQNNSAVATQQQQQRQDCKLALPYLWLLEL
jgi:hypothetical protein